MAVNCTELILLRDLSFILPVVSPAGVVPLMICFIKNRTPSMASSFLMDGLRRSNPLKT